MNLKNIAKGSTESFTVDDGVILLKQTNDNEFASNFNFNISKDYIQFHFCLKGLQNFYLIKDLMFLMLKMKIQFYYIILIKNSQ